MAARWRAAAVLMAVAALSAACNSGGDEPTTTTAKDAGSTQGSGVGRGACFEAPVDPGDGPLKLVDATADRGLEKPLIGMYGHATATADVNDDGWLDLYVGTFADRADTQYQLRGAAGPSPDRLLLGGSDGFEPAPGFPEQYGRSTGAAFADLDGDGDLDLVIARNAKEGKKKPGRKELAGSVVLRNDGDTWAKAADIAAGKGARAVAVLDYDSDGKPDLFVEEDRFTGSASVLLHNQGDFTFEDATAAAGLPADLNGLGAVAADLNLDGRSDLFVSGDNRLFLNAGDGKFREAKDAIPAWEEYGKEDDVAGVDVADVNRDGRPDVLLGQHYNSTLSDQRKIPVRLYLHRGVENGTPRFEDVTQKAGLPDLPTKAPHVQLEDLDNDGFLDIVASASVQDGAQPAVFRNEGVEQGGVPHFASVTGTGDPQYWVTGAVADFDRDGRVDVFLVEFEPAKPSPLFRNETAGGHWLQVAVAPDHAVGTVVEAYRAGGAGDEDKLLFRREIVTGVGYAAGAPPTVHIGLGQLTSVDVRVTPPGAEPEVLKAQKADQQVRFPGDC